MAVSTRLTNRLVVRVSSKVNNALKELAKEEATNKGIEVRKAVVERLKRKGKLNKDENYL